MPSTPQNIPDVRPLFSVLDRKLIGLLRSLTVEQWHKPTIAKLWTVKDVAAHLLDGNIRILSMLRDSYSGENPGDLSYHGLVDYLNNLNADWVKAMKRVSPAMLIFLLEVTGKLYTDYYASLDPFARSVFSVAWLGESESTNQVHIAREYTEKWLHQQQIRYALNDTELMTKELFHPFINIFMLGLPYIYREENAEEGTIVKVTITGDGGGCWCLIRSSGKWNLEEAAPAYATSEIIIDKDTAWKLFSKSIAAERAKDKIIIAGNRQLAEVALTMVSVMA